MLQCSMRVKVSIGKECYRAKNDDMELPLLS